MENDNILVIDGYRYFYDHENNYLVLIDNPDQNLNPNQNSTETINNSQNKFNFDDDYLNHSLKKFEELSDSYENNSNKTEEENFDGNQHGNQYGNQYGNQHGNPHEINEWYMENYDIDFWENLLSRKLDKDERKIIHGIWNETSLNVDIKVLQKNIIQHNCYIKSKTDNIGNCLFESLASLGLGDNDLGINNHTMIRKSLATVLLLAKTEIGFFPKIDLTPEEIFTNSNDIEFIKDKTTGQVYLYDYDMMIYDLNSSFSWERLPTEFILMALSKIYRVEIRIYHNSTNFINKINVLDGIPDNIIRLGQINEEHYFPLEEIPDELKSDPDVIDTILNTQIVYDKYIRKFKKWSKLMMDSMEINMGSSTSELVVDTDSKEKLSDDNFNRSNTYIDSNICLNNSDIANTTRIMKTNKLTIEQSEDQKQISNFEDFDIL
jgi:hypothetical protein